MQMDTCVQGDTMVKLTSSKTVAATLASTPSENPKDRPQPVHHDATGHCTSCLSLLWQTTTEQPNTTRISCLTALEPGYPARVPPGCGRGVGRMAFLPRLWARHSPGLSLRLEAPMSLCLGLFCRQSRQLPHTGLGFRPHVASPGTTLRPSPL